METSVRHFTVPLSQKADINMAMLLSNTTDSLSDSEVWRYTGPFTRFNRFKRAFPGLGIATGAFAVYLVAEQLFLKEEHTEDHHS